MPTISIRLTEEEHAALKTWAHDSRRSIQKEAVYRLFPPPVIPDPTHFKPDPKPGRK